jgi:carbon-monoxide dehydrogenase large subunit
MAMNDVNKSDEPHRTIGQSLLRKEDFRLLTGQGHFGDDFNIIGQAYAVMVRSPHPHAQINSIDLQKARKLPGILAIFTGADVAADRLNPIPHNPVPSTKHDMKLTGPDGGKVFIGPHVLLPVDKARYVGEAVAMVVAETHNQALDGAEAVKVEYKELAWVVDAETALKVGAPVIWDETPDNILVDTQFGDVQATDRAFATAEHTVKMEFHVGRILPLPLEPRAGLAHYDKATGRYTLRFSTGGPGIVRQKRELAAVLGVAPDQLRLISPDTGGNFGAKNRSYVEFGLALWASRKLGRPIKYTATRSESFVSEYQGRDLWTKVELALRSDGRFLAMRAFNVMNVGAHAVSLSPLAKGSGLITGSYDIPVATLRSSAVFTNTVPNNTMRSSGRPEVTFAIERLIDTAAAEMGIDRIELRRKNLVRPEAMPYTNAVGSVYDSGTYEANMDLVLRIADWDGFEARRRAAAVRGKLLGRGFANYVESSTGSPKERTEITITPEGRVKVVIGTQPSGQGHETSFSQVVADLLAVPVDRVDIILGDTDIVKEGGGSHSGRSMRHAATVIWMASTDLIANGKRIAAVLLATTADQIEFVNGRFATPHANRTFDFFELARELVRHVFPDELKCGLAVTKESEMHTPVYPNGCGVCEVEVDPDTGRVHLTRYAAVDDVGRCINPMTVDGQTHGSIAHGVGEALWEQICIDKDTGATLTNSFREYGMPLSATLPPFKTEIVEILSPTNPLGIKSGSEGPTSGAPAVVISGVVDALGEFGIRDINMPATPLTVWQAIQNAKAKGPSDKINTTI